MSGLFNNKSGNDASATLAALSRSQAIIEFTGEGVILSANENFLSAMGYTLAEVRGQHHRMFVDPAYAQSAEYAEFWRKLGKGEYDAGEYKRFGKGAREVWIQASYNPVFDRKGKLMKVVKVAADVTQRKAAEADMRGQLDGLNTTQAVIEFNLDGTITRANANFCRTLGYDISEIMGRQHRMFVDADYAQSPDYR